MAKVLSEAGNRPIVRYLGYGRYRSGARSGIAEIGLAEAAQDLHLQRALHQHLTGEARIRPELLLARQARALLLGHLTGVAVDHLDPAGRAARMAAATMEDIDPRILDRQNQSSAFRRLERLDADRFDLCHRLPFPIPIPNAAADPHARHSDCNRAPYWSARRAVV